MEDFMTFWNENLIEKNIKNIKNKLLKLSKKQDFMFFLKTLDTYEKIQDILSNMTEEKYIKYVEDLNKVGFSFDPFNIEASNVETPNIFMTIYEVSNFLENFNIDYYDYFNDMLKKGLVFLEKGENQSQNHFTDPINNTNFIHIKSDFKNTESIALIREFAKVYQIEKNQYSFNESMILFEDTFPLYLESSMLSFYEPKSKDDILDSLKDKNEELFKLTQRSDVCPIDKYDYSRKITSNYLSMFMLLNNDIDGSFDSVDEFLYKNNKDNRASTLWSIANQNTEQIDHMKNSSLSKVRS